MIENPTLHETRNGSRFPCTHALLVEDEPVYQDLITQAFERLAPDCRVRVCSNGSEAIGLLRQSPVVFDVILIDLGLPDMNGVEVIREARASQPETPVFVASIYSDETHVLEAVRAGARGYLLKDDTAIEISDAIARVIEGEYPISPSLARHLFKLARRADAPSVLPADLVLAPRELEMLGLLAKGHSYKKVAALMGVALSTVQTYIRRVYQKLEAHSKAEAIKRARKLGILE